MEKKEKRKIWTREETLGLLKCYSARKEEFVHSRKKKFAYANVLEDMIFQGLTDSSTTVEALQGKIKTLLNSYKAAKDHQNRTGAAPMKIPYGEEMDEIFGSKPIISNSHTLHVGFNRVLPLSERQPAKPESISATPSSPTSDSAESGRGFSFAGESADDPLSPTEPSTSGFVASGRCFNVGDDSSDLGSPTPSTSGYGASGRRLSHKRKASAPYQQYLAEKLKLKKELGERKLKQKENFLSEMKKKLEEKWAADALSKKEAEEAMRRTIEKMIQK